MRKLFACLCLLTSAVANAGAPGEAAIAFLEAMRDEAGNWEEVTAIFPGTTQEKRLVIAERLSRLGKELEGGDLRTVDRIQEGDLAGVIVSQIVDFDPNQVKIHAVGLLKREGEWQAAPVLASFENTGLRYQPSLAQAAEGIESWMLKQRNHHLTRLRQDILSDLLEDIRASKPTAELLEDSPTPIVRDFILACRDLDTPRALAHLGGLDSKLPEDWRDIVSITSRALHAPWQAEGQWLELTDPSVLGAELQSETESTHATVTLGFFNAARSRPGPTEWTIRHFALEKSTEGHWRLRLPLWLLEEDDESSKALIDQNLYEQFPAQLIATRERKAFETPSSAVDGYLESLMAEEFSEIFPHLSRSIDASACASLISETSRLWRGFKPGTQLPIRLDVQIEEDRAWAIYGGFDPKRPEIPGSTLHHLQLEKDDLGWSIISSDRPTESSDLPPALLSWGDQALARDSGEWLTQLGLNQRIGGLAAAPAADEAEARKITTAWIQGIEGANPREIFSAITGFDDDTATQRIFSFLGQELPAPIEYELLAIHRNGRWAGATIRHRTLEDEAVEYNLLHPIVITPGGPRVLPEAILYHATTRAQRYLNDSVWKRLRSRLPETAVEELESLYREHEKLCKTLNVTD